MFTPSAFTLTDSELHFLDHFLRNAVGTKNNLSLSHLHGFLCAILTGPVLSHINEHAFILDKILTIKDQPASTRDACSLWLPKLIDQTRSALQENTFSPLLFGDKLTGHNETEWELLKEWCQGYLRAVELDSVWVEDEYGLALTMPMGILADEFDLTGHPNAEGQTILDNMPHKILAHKHLCTTIATLYNHWKEQRLSDQKSNKNLH